MSCGHLTVLEVGRTLDVLGIVDLRVSRPSGHGAWLAVATTDDGYPAEAHASLLDEAIGLVVRAVSAHRRRQREAGGAA